MDKLKRIIETVISKEIEEDKGVFADGYVLSPVQTEIGLKGNGKPEELTTSYQIDFFYKSRNKLVAKAKELVLALGDYPTDELIYSWETVPRLWRATLFIETM